jgi:hypothetical protein
MTVIPFVAVAELEPRVCSSAFSPSMSGSGHRNNNLSVSGPDMFRACTSFRTNKKVVDGSDQRGHDGSLPRLTLAFTAVSTEPDTRGLRAAIDHPVRRRFGTAEV